MSRREVRVGLRELEPLDHLRHRADQRLELWVAHVVRRTRRPVALGRNHRLDVSLHGRVTLAKRRLPRLVTELQLQSLAVLARGQRRGQCLGHQVDQRRKLLLHQNDGAIRAGHGHQVRARPAQRQRTRKRRPVNGRRLEHERHNLLGDLDHSLGDLVVVDYRDRPGAGEGIAQLLKKSSLGGMTARHVRPRR